MSKIEDLVDSSTGYGDLVDNGGALTESLSLGREGLASLSDIKPALVKVAKFDGNTFFITNEDSMVSVYLYRASGALKINSISIDGGIQTLKKTSSEVLLVTSTGQEHSLIDNSFRVSKDSSSLNSSKRPKDSNSNWVLAS